MGCWDVNTRGTERALLLDVVQVLPRQRSYAGKMGISESYWVYWFTGLLV